MRVLILGATGMLGSAVFGELSRYEETEVWGTVRAESAKRLFPEWTRANLVDAVDVLDERSVTRVLETVRPDVVINAVGVIKQLEAADDPLIVLPVNAMFPHQLAGMCGSLGARMIQLSSDCVYSGRKGNYKETDLADAEDLYGKSKFIGEVHDEPHVLTLRTSGIGHELNSRNGLLEWFLSQRDRVRGFSAAIYSGLPSIELARVIHEFVFPHPALCGLYHVSSKPISKFDLLTLVADVYGMDITIEPDDTVRIDRSLDSTRFSNETGYVAAEWPELITVMRRRRSRT